MPRAAATLALGVALVLTGGLFDAEPLFVGGIAFVLLAVGSVVWVHGAAGGATVRRELSAVRVVEDEPVRARLRIRPGRLPFPDAAVRDPLLPGPVPVPRGQGERIVEIEARFARRGRRVLDPPALIVRDPLGLAEQRVDGAGEVELLVLPRTMPVDVDGQGADLAAGGLRAALAGASETELDGLRPYRPGSTAARIHWPALARGAGLFERRLRPDGDGRPLVVLDPAGAGSAEDLDAAVRATASICLALATGGGCSVMLPGDRRATRLEGSRGSWPSVHARLALVQGEAPLPPFTAAAARAGTIFFISARSAERTPRALLRIGGARVLVVPGMLPGRRPAFEVAGCRGYAIGHGRPLSAEVA